MRSLDEIQEEILRREPLIRAAVEKGEGLEELLREGVALNWELSQARAALQEQLAGTEQAKQLVGSLASLAASPDHSIEVVG